MFLSLVKYFRGYLLVRLNGYSPERFLNLCSNHNILIWNLSSSGASYEFNISIAGYRKLKPLLKKTKTRVVILQKNGFPFFLYRYRKRKLFFAGIVFGAGFLLYLTTFIWLIDINGNSLITDASILTFLEENGASFGSRKASIDCSALEEALRSAYDDVIWASVRLNGTKMTIDLQENLITGKDEGESAVKPEGAYDLTAEKDGVITSIITRNGTPAVRAGSEVKAGDLLVGSRLDIYNDSNEVCESIYVTADADIFAQTQYAYKDSFPMRFSRKVRTGEGKSSYSVSLFSYQIDLPSFFQKKEPYLSCTESRQLALAKDYYIPVILEKTTYYDCDYENVTLTKAQAKEKANENIAVFLKKLKEKGVQITDKNVMIEFADHTCSVSGTFTAIERIGRYEPAEQNEPQSDERQTENESD